MKNVVVVGSGASGVHFALSVLRKGYDVCMLDVGNAKNGAVHPHDSFDELKANLADPASYFLGADFNSVLFPDDPKEFYGFPPSKEYVFRMPAGTAARGRGFSPLFSFAQGGLGETWTGGVYPFNDDELADFPLAYRDLEPHYAEVSRRIGINGAHDDLARFFPAPASFQEPLRLDEHAHALWSSYRRQRSFLNRRLSCYLGRSRLATLMRDQDGRKACGYLGRCLWGCPNESLYTPSLTLRECQRFPNFCYRPKTLVRHFAFNGGRQITEVVCQSTETGETFRQPVQRLALAAGTLMSSKIFLESIRQASGKTPKLVGLMDNRQIMMPFVNLGMVGRPFNPDSYQYHQLAMGFEEANRKEYVHCQITTLKTALVHPLIQKSPFDLRTSLFLFRHMHAALGLVNVNLHDTRRSGNCVTLEPDAGNGRSVLAIHYAPPRGERRRLERVTAKVKRALWALRCVVPPGLTHIRPPGASVHYAGTVPMSRTPAPFTTSPLCQSHDFPNLYFVDGTTFPFLPAKNITYTLMANAVRVAELAF